MEWKVKLSRAKSLVYSMVWHGRQGFWFGSVCRFKYCQTFNLFPSVSDQDRISRYNSNTISSRQVMRIKTNMNKGIVSWSNTKFSKLTLREFVWQTVRIIPMKILGAKGWTNTLHNVMRLFGNRSLMASKCANNKKSGTGRPAKVAQEAQPIS